MQTFYTNESDVTYLEGVEIVKQVVFNIDRFIIDMSSPDFSFSHIEHDLFGMDFSAEMSQAPKLFEAVSDVEAQMVEEMLLGIKEVILRQYDKYFKLNDVQMAALEIPTSEAKLHNIDAEEMMGMFSAAISRAPNATMAFVSAKLRAVKNGTLTWLRNVPEQQHDCLTKKIVTKTGKLKVSFNERRKAVVEEITCRIAQKMNQRKEKLLKKEEDKLLVFFQDEDATEEAFMEQFPCIDPSHVSMIFSIMRGQMVNSNIYHYWVDGKLSNPVPYNGQIESLRTKTLKRKSGKVIKLSYTICYWLEGQNYDTHGEDYDIPAGQVAVDFINGDLRFVCMA
jgi:hypothetical protein